MSTTLALILHICTLSDRLVGFEHCRPHVIPMKSQSACFARADHFNNAEVADMPRFWRREERRIGQQVLVAPAHCERPWHPTRNPKGTTIFDSFIKPAAAEETDFIDKQST